ncbi:MAG TPA: malto-oligosyltrehalose trehalohydrolase [Pseudolabrys sp.]|nr:malto-oligosyltrehalose trehalohydrolase [Pseudolabrys sp.]
MSALSQFGPLVSDRGVTFRLWAPAARIVHLMLDHKMPMPQKDGWFVLQIEEAAPGARYAFEIDEDITIPDPASHFQPEDVHGPSEVIGHDFAWQCGQWQGLPWQETVFSELHVGTFTKDGTFRAAISKLDHLARTGITAIELMPLADFPGRWNWGYDGVLPFAPDSSYGRPDDLKTLIDAAHARGLMIFLDVVYNHFGPEGNYLGRIAPQFFTTAQTPWGSAIDYRVPEVRRFIIENALHWLRDYKFDGLRLDAVHAIVRPGDPSILHDLSFAAGSLAKETGRHIHLVLENDDNQARFLAPGDDPPAGRYRAQWNDDYHHAWHVLLTGERAGYYVDYGGTCHIERTLTEGFAYQGEKSEHRKGQPRGQASSHLPPTAFVNFIQNHDQIGNRPLGERLTTLCPPEALAAALAVLLLQPSPPLLFMGEEWGATHPFPFFCDFEGELADAVRNGRKKEFAEVYAQHGDEIPDPLSADTRASAVLDWTVMSKPMHAERLALTRALLAVRKRAVIPLLTSMHGDAEARITNSILFARWPAGARTLQLLANLADDPAPRPVLAWGDAIWGGLPPPTMPPWSVYAAVKRR